jgi:hypothetical protein
MTIRQPEDPAAWKYYRTQFGVKTNRQIQKAERKRLKREALAKKAGITNGNEAR